MYAVAYEYLYKKPVKSIFFDFMKYVRIFSSDKDVKGKIIERRDMDSHVYVRWEHAYVSVELTEELKKETIKWLVDTHYMIQDAKKNSCFPTGKKMDGNCFWCKNICSTRAYRHLCG